MSFRQSILHGLASGKIKPTHRVMSILRKLRPARDEASRVAVPPVRSLERQRVSRQILLQAITRSKSGFGKGTKE